MNQNDDMNDFQKAVIASIIGTAVLPGLGTVLGGGFFLVRGLVRCWSSSDGASAAAARRRYEATLRRLENAHLDDLERQTARMRAKQVYLKELDGLMKCPER